jgi:DNA-binding NtrC family response regulator
VSSSTLFSWIGKTDLLAAQGALPRGIGPVARAVSSGDYDRAYLLCDYPVEEARAFMEWLRPQAKAAAELIPVSLSSPTAFGEIYEQVCQVVERVLQEHRRTELTFYLSPGTPAMAAVWIILSKTRYPARLIESSLEHGVQPVLVPFNISADFIPDLLAPRDEALRERSGEAPPAAPEFEDILHRSRVMRRLLARARRAAPRDVPVLLEGESGTGKELLARAVHRASRRARRPFVAVNCGAISPELLESELFGHKKGAFTGAVQDHKGYFEAAGGGTLFLDEVGELSPLAQVKLLRTLQEGTVVSVGSTRPVAVDVRVIAATNRTLTAEVACGRFREDLFYRLAVAVLRLPPLREREGDLGLLIDALLEKVNQESRDETGATEKRLSAAARNALLRHPWPGNVRELLNTLRRVVIWSEGDTISVQDVSEALLSVERPDSETILGRALEGDFSLQGVLDEVSREYIERALRQSGGRKSQAAKLLGFGSYQTLTNWMQRLQLDG